VYDANGQLTEMTDWTGTTSFGLDLLGRITEVNDSNNKTTGYTYDNNGNRASMTYPDNTMIEYVYDPLNRLTAITEGIHTTTYTYDAASRPVSLTYPNGVIEAYTYDALGQLLTTTETLHGAERTTMEYLYDPVGNIISTITDGTTLVTLPEVSTSTFNAMNQLTSKTLSDGTVIDYIYDQRGNLRQEVDRATGNMRRSFVYDATNRMVSGTNEYGETSKYTYNGLGVRTSHTAITNDNGTPNTVTTEYVVDYTSFGQLDLMSLTNDGITTRYTYGIGLDKISATVTIPGNQTQRFNIHTDRLGSGRQATDANGDVIGHTTFDPWGKVQDKMLPYIDGTSVTLDIIGNYTNHEWDNVLGVYYAKARVYDPEIKRFLAPDPWWGAGNRIYGGNRFTPDFYSIQQSSNLYSYVLGNPIRFIDSTGLTAEDARIFLEHNPYPTTRNRDVFMQWLADYNREYAKPSLPMPPNGKNDGYLGAFDTCPPTFGGNICQYCGKLIVELLDSRGLTDTLTGGRRQVSLLDLSTGQSFNISWHPPEGYHTDWDTATKADTDIARGLGTWNDSRWISRPGIIAVDNRYIAVGFHLVPHASGYTSNNDMTGHMCMYYGNSPGGSTIVQYKASMNQAARDAFNWSSICSCENPSRFAGAGQ
jgi:RHS repeat-associated protein